ncbi:hypothetical protein K438DRAFT_1755965 [Mycena galopus ATCC 62051]|nr:hypothetical protein K438DRAFT_1755965 [Mycena galopus ATCC 62051]
MPQNQGVEPPPEDADEDEDEDADAKESSSCYTPMHSVPARTRSHAKNQGVEPPPEDADEDEDGDTAAKGTSGRHAPTRSVFARTGSRRKGVEPFPEDADKEEDEEDGRGDNANETGGPADTQAIAACEPQGTDAVAASDTSGARAPGTPAGTSSETNQKRGTREVRPRPKPKPRTKQVASSSKDPFNLSGRRGTRESTTRPVPVNDDSGARDQVIEELEATDARFHENLLNFQADLRADSQRLSKEIEAGRADSNTLTSRSQTFSDTDSVRYQEIGPSRSRRGSSPLAHSPSASPPRTHPSSPPTPYRSPSPPRTHARSHSPSPPRTHASSPPLVPAHVKLGPVPARTPVGGVQRGMAGNQLRLCPHFWCRRYRQM